MTTRRLGDRYELGDTLGRGGMAEVFSGQDLRLNRRVAVKVLRPDLARDPAFQTRFRREAQSAASLNDPNIVAVYDYGRLEAGAYLVMELLQGVTLRAELTRLGSFAPAVVACRFAQILEGVKAAHAAGIIHRDLKPENVWLCAPGSPAEQIKLLDFGLAKLQQPETVDTSSLTARGLVMGTFGYMPPEQLLGETVDERSDIFALGVMLVEALTGKRPFQGRTAAALLHAITREPAHLTGAAASPAVQRLLQKSLAKEPSERFANVADFQKELFQAWG